MYYLISSSLIFIFSLRRTMFKTLREKVQEAEIEHRDPTTIVLRSTKKRYVVCIHVIKKLHWSFDYQQHMKICCHGLIMVVLGFNYFGRSLSEEKSCQSALFHDWFDLISYQLISVQLRIQMLVLITYFESKIEMFIYLQSHSAITNSIKSSMLYMLNNCVFQAYRDGQVVKNCNYPFLEPRSHNRAAAA